MGAGPGLSGRVHLVPTHSQSRCGLLCSGCTGARHGDSQGRAAHGTHGSVAEGTPVHPRESQQR